MLSYGKTDIGLKRSMNQDNVFYSDEPLGNLPNLYIVADGMGGHKAGEVASSITINHLTDNFNKLDSVGDKATAVNWIRKEAEEINNEIFEYTAAHPESKGMGST